MTTVIWDWNGTLLDDAEVCRSVMDRMLVRRGLPPIGDMARYREIFTFPVRDYYALAGIDLSAESFDDLAEEYMSDYRASSAQCGLMPGAAKTLDALEVLGAVHVLASASRQDDLERQVVERGMTGRFRAVLGMADQLGGGKAGLAAGYLHRNGIDPADTLFVGDTVHDWQTAASVGSRCVLISAGHQSRARLEATGGQVLDDISELPALFAAWIK